MATSKKSTTNRARPEIKTYTKHDPLEVFRKLGLPVAGKTPDWVYRLDRDLGLDIGKNNPQCDEEEFRELVFQEIRKYSTGKEDDDDQAPAPYLIDGLINRGEVVLIIEDSGSEMSRLALDIGRSVSEGLEWFDMATEESPVVIIDRNMQRDLHAPCCADAKSKKKCMPIAEDQFETKVWMMGQGEPIWSVLLRIGVWFREKTKPLVIINRLDEFLPLEACEDDATAVTSLMETLKRIARKFEITIAIPLSEDMSNPGDPGATDGGSILAAIKQVVGTRISVQQAPNVKSLGKIMIETESSPTPSLLGVQVNFELAMLEDPSDPAHVFARAYLADKKARGV